MTRNKIRIYKLLKDTGLTPQLYWHKETEDGIYLKTEYLNDQRPANMFLTDEIVNLAIMLSEHHLSDSQHDIAGLRTCLSHGDFCPWNILIMKGNMRLIDWEMADERTLGYDLFTYICQITILFHPKKDLLKAIEKNHSALQKYFQTLGVSDYTFYLREFAKIKSNENHYHALKYKNLLVEA